MSGHPLSNVELVDMLCGVSPSLREARRCHLASYSTLIPHLFMGDVLACVGRCVGTEAAGGDRAELRAILETLENAIAHGDRETRNVVAISFATDSRLETFFAELQPYLGPRMRAALRAG